VAACRKWPTASVEEDGAAETATEDMSGREPESPQSARREEATRRPDIGRPEPDVAAPDEVATPEAQGLGTGEARTGGDLSEARAALVRTLSHMARQAESTDDATRAKQYLAATREAAEALAALDSVRQR
jgi:hypothetical protein